VLPEADRDVFQDAVEVCGGKQCHPFLMIAGQIIRLARTGALPQGATCLFPVTEGSCLITQYVPAIERALRALGREDVTVAGTRSTTLSDRFGMGFLMNLGRGVIAIEYLLRLRYELRPYEANRGEVDAVYSRGLSQLVEGLAAGQLQEGLMAAVLGLSQVATRDRGTRPVIGIAGDVYTRVNPVANGNLFEILESLGCEVWLSPTLVDVSWPRPDLAGTRRPRYRELWDATYSWASGMLMSMELWQIQRHFKGLLRNLFEPEQEAMIGPARELLGDRSDVLLMLNVSKHIDFARKKVDGILNVFCLNCMVGTSTAAIFPAIKEKVGEVPMMSLVFDGLETTHTRNRIEAFVHRVNRNLAARPRADAPGEGAPGPEAIK